MSDDGTDAVDEKKIVERTQEWLEKVVIGLQLCPFAKAVHVEKRIRYKVSQAHNPAELLHDLALELETLVKADARVIDTTLLIHPLTLHDFIEYNEFLKTADDRLAELRLDGVIQIASFHPGYQFADTEANAVENFTNRSPYPMLHLLRESSVAKAIDNFGDVDGIYKKNIETMRRLGLKGWQKLKRTGGAE